MNINKSKGFTLVELLLSVVLGSIIVSGAISLYVTAQKTQIIQANLAELQERTHMALSQIKTSLSKSALYSEENNQNLENGVLFKGIPSDSVLVTTGEVGASYVNKKSDQLTVKYLSPKGGFDCEGDAIPENGQVVERYFVRPSKSDKNTLALVCDAGRVGSGSIDGFGDDGIELLTGVLYFHTLFTLGSGDEYKSYATANSIVDQNSVSGVQIGLMFSSVGSGAKHKDLDVKRDTYQVIDQEVSLKPEYSENAQKGLIDVIEQRVILNGAGVEI